jgi:tetratricopeptide (TPR) repeat protein
MKLVHLRLLLLLSLFFFACSESKETRLQRFLAQGNDAVQKQNYEEAERFYQGALQLDSCFEHAWNNLGSLQHQQQNFSKAVEYYSRAIQCAPEFTDAFVNRINTYYELKEYFKALKDLKSLESIRPDTLPLHLLRGIVYTEMSRYKEAKESFHAGLHLDPGNDDLLTNIGTVYYYEKKHDSASMYLQKVVSKNNRHTDALNVLALTEAEVGETGKALEHINEALALSPNNAYYLNNRGYIFLLMGDDTKALEDIDRSIVLNTENPWAYRNKGIYYLKNNQIDDAIRLLEQARGDYASMDKVAQYLGEAYLKKGDRGKACESLKTAFDRGEISASDFSKKCR